MSRLRAVLRRREARADSGASLVELLVAILVFGIVATMLSAWFISGVRSSARSIATTDDLNATHAGFQRLTRDLQMAVQNPTDSSAGPIDSGAWNSVTFYTRVIGNTTFPAKVTWSVINTGGYKGVLRRSLIAPVVSGEAVSWPTADTRTKDWIPGVNAVNNGKIPPVFRFLDASNSAKPALCSDATPAPPACASTLSLPLTTASARTVRSVEVFLQVSAANDAVASTAAPYFQTSKRSGNPIVLRTRVFPQSNTVT